MVIQQPLISRPLQINQQRAHVAGVLGQGVQILSAVIDRRRKVKALFEVRASKRQD